ncbi:PH domain-containing protein [Pseudonocardia hispaniensis]|uniref:PH domain-containing protein n=1 Tax=Pseudonocardia hispaniensis TaxID=904933 RepID=A0ABW1J177_9PSEU
MSTPAEQVVVRPHRVMWVAWIGAVLTVVLFVVIAVLLPKDPTGVYFRFADQVAVVLIGTAIAGGFLLLARPRARADADGIEVRNIVLTRYLPWDQVMAVTFPDGASWARLELPDDEYLPVLAIQAVDGGYAVDRIRTIRALHAAARSRPDRTDSGR